jgi:hypothetical protein
MYFEGKNPHEGQTHTLFNESVRQMQMQRANLSKQLKV